MTSHLESCLHEEMEYKIEHDAKCLVWCYDCNTRCAIEKMHLHHKVGVVTLGEVEQMTLDRNCLT